ncbi:Membrane protein, putative [Brucella suis bv. 2]|nr:Membrane protein, putative [Brucella suis bv. 2]
MSVQRASFYILLTLVTIAFAWLLIPYYTAVLWAVIMAVIFYPVQQWLVLLLRGRRNIAAFLSVLMCICLVIIPMLAIFGSLVDEGTSLYQRLSSREFDINGYIARIMAALPESLEEWLKRFELGTFADWRARISSVVMQGSQLFAARLVSFGQNTLQFFIGFGIMLTFCSSSSATVRMSAKRYEGPFRSAMIIRASFWKNFPPLFARR